MARAAEAEQEVACRDAPPETYEIGRTNKNRLELIQLQWKGQWQFELCGTIVDFEKHRGRSHILVGQGD